MGSESDSLEDGGGGIGDDPNGLAVHQIVLWGDNLYVQYFGGWVSAGDGRWEAPEDTWYNLATWVGAGGRVVVHHRHPRGQVVRDGWGRSRFLYGGGMQLFMVREMGTLPEGVEVGGQRVGGMAMVWGVEFPLRPDSIATYHLVPPEYLMDLPYPGLPSWVSLIKELCWIPPPPVFSLGDPVWGCLDLAQAQVGHSISIREAEEEDGGPIQVDVVRRGDSYMRLVGLH